MGDPITVTMADMEVALRRVLRQYDPLVIESKVGRLYGSAFKIAEKNYDAWQQHLRAQRGRP